MSSHLPTPPCGPEFSQNRKRKTIRKVALEKLLSCKPLKLDVEAQTQVKENANLQLCRCNIRVGISSCLESSFNTAFVTIIPKCTENNLQLHPSRLSINRLNSYSALSCCNSSEVS